MLDLSVVIPLYKAADYLPALFASLEDQTFSRDRFEVVLVDDGSPDDTRTLAEKLAAQSSLMVQLVWRESNGGVSAARNSGWQSAQAPLIVFMDQDCLAHPDLLQSYYDLYAAAPGEKIAGVGRIVWAEQYRENPASEYFKATYFPAWDSYQADGSNFQLYITSNASAPKAALAEAGGFDEAFRHNYDDVSCGHRLEQAGYALRLCPAALVYHNRPLPVPEMVRRTNLAGHEMARFFQRYPELIGHWWLLNPARALDWADHLASIEGLLADTLEQLTPAELAVHSEWLVEAGHYLRQNPFRQRIDRLYLQTWLARHYYQRDLAKANWLEARFALGQSKSRIKSLRLPQLLKKEPPVNVAGLISVLTVLTSETTEAEWRRFLAGLVAQQDQGFELVVAGPAGLREQFRPGEVGFACRYVPGGDWLDAGRQATGDLVVLLPPYCYPDPQLLAAYRQHCRPKTVLVGLELPLVEEIPPPATLLPDLSGLELGEPARLHFSAYGLANSALERRLFLKLAELFQVDLSPSQRDLVAGWLLAEQSGVRLQSCPAARVYASQTRRLAQRWQDYAARPSTAANLEKWPELARLDGARSRRQPTPEKLHLLYDTFKEYPLARGLAAGLQELFGLTIYNQLKTAPLFAGLTAEWEAQRSAILQAEYDRLRSGQVELTRYIAEIEQKLGG